MRMTIYDLNKNTEEEVITVPAYKVGLGIAFVIGIICGYFIWGIFPSWPLIKQLFYSCF